MARKFTIGECQNFANTKKGTCLSNNYISGKMQWQCERGHTWYATYDKIRRNQWCQECKKIDVLSEIQQIAISHKGLCLSNEYVNITSKMRFKCENNHIFESSADKIKRGNWCQKCAGFGKTMDDLHKIADQKNGKCLSTEYHGVFYKYQWECNVCHNIWDAQLSNIMKGTWCPQCGRENSSRFHQQKRHGIEKCRDMAKSKNGECLSTEYINKRQKLLWKCHLGHEWESRSQDVLNGSWCPICNDGELIGEHVCREFMERIFNAKFPRKRPVWLKNDETNGRCELDGYNEELKIAFEYNGKQHYEYVPKFHRNGEFDLEKQQQTDQFKQEECQKRGIILIIVPYNIKYNQIQNEILTQYQSKSGKSINIESIDWTSFRIPSIVKLDEMKSIAEAKGGKCLSDTFIDSSTKLLFICDQQHQFWTVPSAIRSGVWCPECAGIYPIGIEVLQEFAKNKGGKCLSADYYNVFTKYVWQCNKGHIFELNWQNAQNYWCSQCNLEKNNDDRLQNAKKYAEAKGGKLISSKYLGSHTRHQWMCKNGHIFSASIDHVLRGDTWCSVCKGTRHHIDDFRKVALENGGECLSNEYINDTTKLKFRCKNGHEWSSFPLPILDGQWCARCKGWNKTIEEIRNLAKSKGGECLSTEYINAHTLLEWKCEKGHIWKARYNTILISWCPKCGSKSMGEKHRKWTLHKANAKASQRGGKCIEIFWENGKCKGKFECFKGHQWVTSPNNIKRGTWCPICHKIKRGINVN